MLDTNNITSSTFSATLITGGTGSQLGNVSRTLQQPRQTTIVDSWAAILE